MIAAGLLYGLGLCMLVGSSGGARILLLPYPMWSHTAQMQLIGAALARRGHDLHMVLSPSFSDFDKHRSLPWLNVIPFVLKDPDFNMIYEADSSSLKDFVEEQLTMTAIEDMRYSIKGFAEFCSNILSDTEMYAKLKDLNFDLAIVDVFPCSRCQLVIPYRLGIPFISLTTMYEPWLHRTPALPSFVPFQLAEHYTERMSFTERLMNAYYLLDWSYSPRMPYLSDEAIRQYITDREYKSLDDIALESKLWFFDTDFVIDYPRPMMPNHVNIGGITTKPAKPLPQDLQAVMDSATEGAIVMTFGSTDLLAQSLSTPFLNAFKELKLTAILRSTNIHGEVPDNVKIFPWIPQNDLLGHNNTVLFITHAGANSQFEALYHAVPMLCIPIYGDQPYNSRRIAYHGFGLYLTPDQITTESLLGSIKYILNNHSIYENIQRASAILRSQPMHPQERAAFWVEQVLNFGADHLQSYALKLEWYQYLMLDIFGFVVGMCIALCAPICFFIRR